MIATGVGEAVGPILSSVLYDQFGFREAADIFAFLIVIYAIAYFALVGHIRMFIRRPSPRSPTNAV